MTNPDISLDPIVIDMDIDQMAEFDMDIDVGGGSGTTDYNALTNKPKIEGVTLQGNKTFPQLGLERITPQDIDDIMFGV